MTSDQLEQIENLVNEAISADMEIVPMEKSRDEAIAEGAMHYSVKSTENLYARLRFLIIMRSSPMNYVEDAPSAYLGYGRVFDYQ